nr:MAG TPA: hypothetical protein [Caudoviricetes sp.]
MQKKLPTRIFQKLPEGAAVSESDTNRKKSSRKEGARGWQDRDNRSV